jgi:hypothetical protein
MTRFDAPNVRYLRRPANHAAPASRRIQVNWPAEVRCGDKRLPCTIIDISSAGAQIQTDRLPDQTGRLWLVLDRAGPIPAVLAWRRNGRLGLRFLREQHWLHGLGAKRFDASAWMNSGNR